MTTLRLDTQRFDISAKRPGVGVGTAHKKTPGKAQIAVSFLDLSDEQRPDVLDSCSNAGDGSAADADSTPSLESSFPMESPLPIPSTEGTGSTASTAWNSQNETQRCECEETGRLAAYSFEEIMDAQRFDPSTRPSSPTIESSGMTSHSALRSNLPPSSSGVFIPSVSFDALFDGTSQASTASTYGSSAQAVPDDMPCDQAFQRDVYESREFTITRDVWRPLKRLHLLDLACMKVQVQRPACTFTWSKEESDFSFSGSSSQVPSPRRTAEPVAPPPTPALRAPSPTGLEALNCFATASAFELDIDDMQKVRESATERGPLEIAVTQHVTITSAPLPTA